MYNYLWAAFALLLFWGCSNTTNKVEEEHKRLAEQFIRGIYVCNPSVVDSLAGDDVFISYPIFEKLFNTSAIRGREAVKKFAEGFCSRWTDAHITIHESIAEKDKVILVWSFRAINVGSVNPDVEPTNQEQSWGGITLFRFNEAGKIIAEIGEESTPGPFERSSGGTK